MIQDIAPHVYHNEYQPTPPTKDSYIIAFQDGKMMVREEDGQISFPRFGELEEAFPHIYETYRYLFAIDDDKFYLVENVEFECELYKRNNFREKEPQHLAFAAITAFQLREWYRSRKFCGRCGYPMVHAEKERMMYCEECHQMEFPKICPAVIVGVTNGNKILMSKYAGREHTRYALIAGFTEIGETIEETVKREVMEEVGLKVKNITYYKCQPWSFSDSLLFGFYAELDGDDVITLDEDELATAEWIAREDIPYRDGSNSLTNEMIMNFRNGGCGR